MGSTIIFKRLFEVRILHDYFLTTNDGISYFERNKAEKDALLESKIANNAYNVADLFTIEPTKKTKKLLNSNKFAISTTATGFFVGTEVEVIPKDGKIFYKPVFPFSNTDQFSFSIQTKIPLFTSFTNIVIKPELKANYYFTNTSKVAFLENTIPSYTALPITEQVSAHQNGKSYEMGALAMFDVTLKEANQFSKGDFPANWTNAIDRRYVTENDLQLVSNKIEYKFKTGQNITKAVCTLQNLSDEVVKIIEVINTTGINGLVLDFSRKTSDPNSEVIVPGTYKLKVVTNDTDETLHTIRINEEWCDPYQFGFIDIRLDELNSPFSLLDTDGLLKTHIDELDNKIEHPVFEIRFNNRNVFWRYKKEGDFTPAEIAATASFFNHEPELLTSKQPKELTQSLVPFINGSSLLLPQPKTPSIKIEQQIFLSEIIINQSNRLLST